MELYEILNLVDAGQQLKENPFDGDFPMRGSALTTCSRAMTHLLYGMPKSDVSARQLRTFEVGHQRGAGLGDALELGLRVQYPEQVTDVEWHQEYRCKIPTKIEGAKAQAIMAAAIAQVGGNPDKVPMALENERLFILGSIDFLFINHAAKEIWVIDWKTKHSWGFKKLNDEGVDLGYAVQVSAYSLAMKHQFPNYTVRAAVYYEDKNDAKHRPIEVELEDWDSVLQDYLDKAEQLLLGWVERSGDLPAPDYEPNEKGALPWQCNYCSVGPDRGKCFPGVVDQRQAGKDIPAWKVPV